MKKFIELRSAEGGEDAQLFAHDLGLAYMKWFSALG